MENLSLFESVFVFSADGQRVVSLVSCALTTGATPAAVGAADGSASFSSSASSCDPAPSQVRWLQEQKLVCTVSPLLLCLSACLCDGRVESNVCGSVVIELFDFFSPLKLLSLKINSYLPEAASCRSHRLPGRFICKHRELRRSDCIECCGSSSNSERRRVEACC